MSAFGEYRSTELAPTWLRGTWGTAWNNALGGVEDDQIERAKQSVLARFPSFAPSEALEYIGRDRVVERGPAETDDSYRARLLTAPLAWEWAGTDFGVLTYGLAPAGVPNARIIHNADWTPLPPDGDADLWARWWLVIGTPTVPDWAPEDYWGDDSGLDTVDLDWWDDISAVTATGTGPALTVTSATDPTGRYDVRIQVLTGGAFGVARYHVSLDGGATWGMIATMPIGRVFTIEGTNLTCAFASGTFTAGDSYQFFTSGPGTWGSTMSMLDVTRIRRIVAQWKSAHTVFEGWFLTFGTGTRIFGDGGTFGEDGDFGGSAYADLVMVFITGT